MTAPSTTFCRCGCGQAVEHVPSQLTYRNYATATCAARALAKRLGYTSRVGAVNIAPTTTVDGGTTMAKKSTTAKKAAAKKATAKATPYTLEKLRVQSKLAIGSHHTYNGTRKPFAGKRVKVTGHETRGGIHIELDGKKLTCSPFALGVERPDAKPAKTKRAPAKAAKKATGKGKAGGTSKPTPKAPQSTPPAPAAPAPAAPPAQAKAGKAIARKAA